MSYILEALKKAEEERGASPRAVPTPRALPPIVSARWPWIAGGALALAVAGGAVALWTLGPSTRPVVATAPTPAAVAPRPATVELTPHVPPASRAESAPRGERLARPEPAARAEQAARAEAPARIEPPARVEPPVRVDTPARVASAPRVEPPVRAEPSARVESRARVESPARAESPARIEPAPPPPARPSTTTAPLRAPATRTDAGERVAVAPPSSATRGSGQVRPAPSTEQVRVAPGPVASAPPAAVASGEAKALAAKLSLQVLGWAPEPRDRFVFINGRKYGEGQAIEDKLIVERIAEDSVVLTYQGERVTLKNP